MIKLYFHREERRMKCQQGEQIEEKKTEKKKSKKNS